MKQTDLLHYCYSGAFCGILQSVIVEQFAIIRVHSLFEGLESHQLYVLGLSGECEMQKLVTYFHEVYNKVKVHIP